MWRKITHGFRPGKDEEAAPWSRRRERKKSPPSPLEFSDGPLDQFARLPPNAFDQCTSSLEALNLEPLVSLRPVREFVVTREAAMNPGPGRRPSIEMGLASPGSFGIIMAAPQTPIVERSNPFDSPPDPIEPVITPIPRRPQLKRNAVSARTRHDMPLRVQAMRRMHQEAMAQAIFEQHERERNAAAQPPPTLVVEQPSQLWQRRAERGLTWDQFGSLPHVAMPSPDELADALAAYQFSADPHTPRAYNYSQDPHDNATEDPFEFDG